MLSVIKKTTHVSDLQIATSQDERQGGLRGRESGGVLEIQTLVYDWCPMKGWVQENDAVWQTG